MVTRLHLQIIYAACAFPHAVSVQKVLRAGHTPPCGETTVRSALGRAVNLRLFAYRHDSNSVQYVPSPRSRWDEGEEIHTIDPFTNLYEVTRLVSSDSPRTTKERLREHRDRFESYVEHTEAICVYLNELTVKSVGKGYRGYSEEDLEKARRLWHLRWEYAHAIHRSLR